jgi:hypothetical protein
MDDAYFAVGCCLPDWLSACDRKCRAREKNAVKFVDDSDPIVAATARGVVQHHQDDDWFHRTPIFNRLILKFAVELKELYGNERSMRPSLIAHIMVEVFLDAYLNAKFPGKLDLFYQLVGTVDGEKIQSAINLFATRPTDKLADEVRRFVEARYLFDYDTNEGARYRINRVLKAVKLDQMDDRVFDWMPSARERVYENAEELLVNLPAIQ